MTMQTDTIERTTTKKERIDLRTTPKQKEMFQRAAALSGRSTTEFLLASGERAAEEIIHRHQVVSLSLVDSRVFAEALLRPAIANSKLRATIARYNEEVTEEL